MIEGELRDRIDEIESEVFHLEDEASSLEREVYTSEIKIEELEEKLDECESPTFGMSISQVSCYETFMDILERLPKPAHEIEEELIKIFLNDK